jgi:hypothetical protein
VSWPSGWAFREPTPRNLSLRLEANRKASPELSNDLSKVLRKRPACSPLSYSA